MGAAALSGGQGARRRANVLRRSYVLAGLLRNTRAGIAVRRRRLQSAGGREGARAACVDGSSYALYLIHAPVDAVVQHALPFSPLNGYAWARRTCCDRRRGDGQRRYFKTGPSGLSRASSTA